MPGMVGQFPSMREMMRRTVRGPDNPLDKSTVVSIYPKPINFKNVTLSPGRWRIEAGSYENPALLIVGPSSWWKDVAIDEPLIEIVQSSVQIAESLVKDWINGLFACDMQNAMPGLFFIPGKFTIEKVKGDWGSLLSNANTYQNNYYASLIKYAEALWARSNGNPLAVNDEMRLAARALGRQDVDWMKQEVNTGMKPCFACGEFKNPAYPICKSCGTVDPEHPLASKIVKADPFGSLGKK
jgi:hypothetical protein